MSLLNHVVAGIQRVFGQAAKPARPPSRPVRRFQPTLEALEARELLSASPTVLASQLAAPSSAPPAAAVGQPLPVLEVIANQDFYYKEYADTRESLEQAGLTVQVAAGTLASCRPHANSGQGTNSGIVQPDVALPSVSASNYSAVVFIGGYGPSAYQYQFPGTYVNAAYNGTPALRAATNQLITDFVHQGKYVTAICHGVSVLAWARVDGVSPLQGKHVTAFEGVSPTYRAADGTTVANPPDRWNAEINGATVSVARSIGDIRTATDDVTVDGHIITAENWDSARMFGQVVADHVLNG